MKIKLNRRTFLAVLGATTVAVATAKPKPRTPPPTNPTPKETYFFNHLPTEPFGRPRTSAITYLRDS